MYFADSHMHSIVSRDSESPRADMARGAVAHGVSEICFTDHFDILDIDGSYNPNYDWAPAREQQQLALAACGFLLWTLARWTKGGMTLRAYVHAQTVRRLPAEALIAAGMSAFGAVGQGIALLLENSVNWAKIGHFSALAVAAGLFIRTHVLMKRTVYDFIDATK